MRKSQQAKQVDNTPGVLSQLWPRLAILVLIILCGRAIIAAGGSFLAEIYKFRAKEVLNILRTRRDYEVEPATFRAIRFDPQDGYAHYFLGAFYHRQHRPLEAEQELRRSLQTMAHPSLSLMLLARIMIAKEDYDQARRLYERAFRMNPHPQTEPGEEWYFYGYSCWRAGFLGRAAFAWRQAIDYGYDKSESLKKLAMANLKLRHFLMALYELKSLGLTEGYNPYILEDIIKIYKLTQSYDEALSFFLWLRDQGKLPAEMAYLPAVFYYLKGNHQEAIIYLEDLIKQSPQNKNAYLLLGEIYYNLKDKNGLTRIYSTLLERWPDAGENDTIQRYLKEAEQW